MVKHLRRHRFWRERDSPASPEGRAKRQVGEALALLGTGSRRRNPAVPDATDASAVAEGADADEDEEEAAVTATVPRQKGTESSGSSSSAGVGGHRRRLRQGLNGVQRHRFWQERDSSASPEGRARRQVGEALALLGTGHALKTSEAASGPSANAAAWKALTAGSPRLRAQRGVERLLMSLPGRGKLVASGSEVISVAPQSASTAAGGERPGGEASAVQGPNPLLGAHRLGEAGPMAQTEVGADLLPRKEDMRFTPLPPCTASRSGHGGGSWGQGGVRGHLFRS